MTKTKPNTAFWAIAVIALLWYIWGVFQMLTVTVLMSDEMKAQMPSEVISIMDTLPSWYNYIFAIAVIMGFLAALVMILRKRLAIPLYGIALIAALVLEGYWLFGTDIIATEGVSAAILPVVVIAVAIFLYYYSKGAAQKGWLR